MFLLLHLFIFSRLKRRNILLFLLSGSPCGCRKELLGVNINSATHGLQDRFKSSNFIGYFAERLVNI